MKWSKYASFQDGGQLISQTAILGRGLSNFEEILHNDRYVHAHGQRPSRINPRRKRTPGRTSPDRRSRAKTPENAPSQNPDVSRSKPNLGAVIVSFHRR